MEKSTKIKIGSGVVALVVAFAFGRWSAPEKIKTVEKIVEVEKKQNEKEQDQNKHKKFVKREIVKPDGTKETVTVVVDDSSNKNSEKSSEEKDKFVDKEKEVTKSSSRTTISALGGVKLGFTGELTSEPVYGGSVYRDVLGPIGIGIWGLNNGTCGASVGISF